MLGSYPGLINHLGGKSNVQILPMLQEVNDYPCDIGSVRSCFLSTSSPLYFSRSILVVMIADILISNRRKKN